jgi:mannose-6-phosphate isomerase-like protein (cupin superfamily)
MNQPIIVPPHNAPGIDGQTICIHEWRGSGPATLHVHHEDDEAWYVLEGELRFRFGDRSEVAPAGSTVSRRPVCRTHTRHCRELAISSS